MKKVIPILFFILLVTSVTSFAAGEDFLYTTTWYQSVYTNGSYRITSASGSSTYDITTNSSAYLMLGGQLQGSLQDPNPYIYYKVDNTSSTQINTYLPIGIQLEPSQEITLQFVVIYDNGYYPIYPAYTVSFIQNNPSATFYTTTSVTTYSPGEVVNITLSSTGNPIGTTTIESGRHSDLIEVSYTNNTSDTINLDRLNFVIGVRSGSISNDVIIGNMTSGNSAVTLPSYVEDRLITIGNDIKAQLQKLDDILTQLDLIQQELADLNINFTDNSTTQNNFYENAEDFFHESQEYQEYIQTASPEVVEKVEQIQQEYISATEEYDEVISSLEGVKEEVPEFFIEDIQNTLNQSIAAFEGADLYSSIFQSVGRSSIFTFLILSVLIFGHIGFVLFGER